MPEFKVKVTALFGQIEDPQIQELEDGSKMVIWRVPMLLNEEPWGHALITAIAGADGTAHLQHGWEPAPTKCPHCEDGCVMCDDSVTIEELREKLAETHRQMDELRAAH